ncbi:MAG: phosphatase PAP2 family protein [Sphingobacteriales bacterium]|nr:MAG: phosphatase PAP2 family protein [Sphingobacteriales bacterium]
MEKIIALDRQLFSKLNGEWHSAFFDSFFPILRTSQTSYALYIFLGVFVLLNADKNKWWWIIFTALTAVLTDFVSSDLIKETFLRLRPCNDDSLIPPARFLLSYRPQSSSFTSSHAVNHFGLAAFFYYTLRHYFKKWALLFFLWAGSICYAQVYVGVHYPIDVFCGMILGILLGLLSIAIYRYTEKKVLKRTIVVTT